MDNNTEKLDVSAVITAEMLILRDAFVSAGFAVRVVGGAVRDLCLGLQPKDIDLATDATPDEMKVIFQAHGLRWLSIGEAHGTLTVLSPHSQTPVEITTLRVDVTTDGRHAEVAFSRDWLEDSMRRDLTYNAMSMDFDGHVFDAHGGRHDLRCGQTRFVGDPGRRIQEDYLRILRFFRFMGRFGHAMDEHTRSAIAAHVDGLHKISGERIWMEMQRLLCGPAGTLTETLSSMGALGVLEAVGMPAVHVGDGVAAVREWTDNPITILAMLTGDTLAFQALSTRWRLSRAEHALGVFLLENSGGEWGMAQAQDMLVDGVPQGHVTELFATRRRANPLLDWAVPSFPVTGRDLMAQGCRPGPEMGERLRRMRTQWVQSRFVLTRDELLAWGLSESRS